jgi:hypothetical protein
MPLTLPPDFARDVTETLRYYPDSRPAKAFYRLVQADTPWRPGIPRRLVRAANHAAVSTADGERPLQIVLTGFRCPERSKFLLAAIAMLRQAMKDVADGREAKLIYVHRDSLLVFIPPAPASAPAPAAPASPGFSSGSRRPSFVTRRG